MDCKSTDFLQSTIIKSNKFGYNYSKWPAKVLISN